MVASLKGVVAWQRRDGADDPVRGVLGCDEDRPERIADRRLMRILRCFGDVAVGAQTLRDQPTLVQLPREPGEAPAEELYRFRMNHGLSYQPRTVVYSLFGRLPLQNPVFNTPGVNVIAVTSESGAREVARRGGQGKALTTLIEPIPGDAALRRAQQRLFAEHNVRYLACEGGVTVLQALRSAELLDELFLTTTDILVNTESHDGILTMAGLECDKARLIAEGRISPDSPWIFRRWRYSER
jgi:riboflavin biosynthesis pyrimidine reductase